MLAQRVINLAKEAELYRAQGLLTESRKRYFDILKQLENDSPFPNRNKLRELYKSKIRATNKELQELRKASDTPKLSKDMHTLIKKLFSFSPSKKTAALEGATALAKFGQYKQALSEFHRLLLDGVYPLQCAKNILYCHLALSETDMATDQMKAWISSKIFSFKELEKLRDFLEKAFKKMGVRQALPALDGAETDESREEDEFVLEISAFCVHFNGGDSAGHVEEFDVTFQVGNTISCVIPAHQERYLDKLSLGMRLPEIHFYSPLAEFQGSGVISGKTKIQVGPRAGDHVLDITIDL